MYCTDPFFIHSDCTAFCCTCIADAMTSAAVLQRLQLRASQADLMLNQLRDQLRYLKSKAGAYVCRYHLLNDHEIGKSSCVNARDIPPAA